MYSYTQKYEILKHFKWILLIVKLQRMVAWSKEINLRTHVNVFWSLHFLRLKYIHQLQFVFRWHRLQSISITPKYSEASLSSLNNIHLFIWPWILWCHWLSTSYCATASKHYDEIFVWYKSSYNESTSPEYRQLCNCENVLDFVNLRT